MAAHQAPPSLGFSRQEHWSGLPFPSPMHESENWKWSCSVVSDFSWPHGLQPTRLSIHGIFQARVLEWGAIAFSACLSTIFFIAFNLAALGLRCGMWDLLVVEGRIFSCGMRTLSCSTWDQVLWPKVTPRLPVFGAWSLSLEPPGKYL